VSHRHAVGDDRAEVAEGSQDIRVAADECPERAYFGFPAGPHRSVHTALINGLHCSAYSTLKIEAICSSKTSVDFQRTTQRYIPKQSNLHNHRCENLRPYISFLLLVTENILSTLVSWAICPSANII
jgi:hypothetical protein